MYSTVLLRKFGTEWIAYSCSTGSETSLGNEDQSMEDVINQFNQQGYFLSGIDHTDRVLLLIMSRPYGTMLEFV